MTTQQQLYSPGMAQMADAPPGAGGGTAATFGAPRLLSDATEQDLRKVQEFIRSQQFADEVIAVFRVSEKNRTNTANAVCGIFLCPLFWIHGIILCPCLCMARQSALAILGGTIYAVGRKNIYKIVDAEVGGGCYRTGRDSGYVPLKDVTSVSVDSREGGMLACFPTESVTVGLPLGSPIATQVGRGAAVAQLRMLVANPDEASVLLRQAKEAAVNEATQQQAVQMQQMMMAGMAAGVAGTGGMMTAPAPMAIGAPMPMQQPGGARLSGGAAGGDCASRLATLKNMHDQGLITDGEYELKKARDFGNDVKKKRRMRG